MNVLGIPSVELVLSQPALRALLAELPRELVVECVRECVAAVRADRQRSAGEGTTTDETAAQVAEMAAARLGVKAPRSLRRVVNATGVIIHTNLGRSPIGPAAIKAMAEVAGAYCNLEVDLATGSRAHRDTHVADLLMRLTGAEAATVVNNNAAALVLALTALAAGQRVLCSRGELVEIGGSFRLPEIIACSGAQMVEVGTTNRTRLADYEAALTHGAAAILKIHPSNFRIVGFACDVAVKPLAELARRSGALLLFDTGSGLLLPGREAVFAQEPVVRQAVADGADLVTFSTDKLLGGPQGGALVGRRALVQSINRHPLKRALRVCKVTLAGLEATLRAHLHAGAPDTVTMHLIRRPVEDVAQDAQALAEAIRRVAPRWAASPEADESSIGGGSLPGETVPTVVVWLEAAGHPAGALDAAFRAHEPPIFGRFRRSRFGLDVRTLLPDDARDILDCVQALATGRSTAQRAATQ
ncbi:MAG TPA: L-seryl-tRNA(Sec) selenium transferase [Planctomycetota bacterium]|nr:L-seryl-tRNA(Sec) selenium transferase [Planctomycetota bacterium]HRR78592.1 L-seryl-tRNA(Sec) selenium transferase [Planctomycetota bacterium]